MKFNYVRWNVKVTGMFFHIYGFLCVPKASVNVCKISKPCCLPCVLSCQLYLKGASQWCILCTPSFSSSYVCVRICQRNVTGFLTISAELKCELFDLTTLSIAKSICSVDCRWISVSMEHWWFETRRGNPSRTRYTKYVRRNILAHSRLFYTSSAIRTAFQCK